MQVIVDGLLCEYELEGHGPLLVWIHGWGDNFSSNPLVARLAKQYSVLTPHLPGFGGSQLPVGIWGLDEYASFVAHFLNKLEQPLPVALIGHSNGGAIAIKGLSTKVLSAGKLVLLDSAGIRSGDHFTFKAIAKIGKIATAWMPSAYRRRLKQKLYRTVGSDLLVKPELSDSFKKIIRQDIVQDASIVQIPTLIVYGQDDNDTPPEYGRILADVIKRSELAIIPHAGHFVYLDQTDAVYNIVHKFIV